MIKKTRRSQKTAPIATTKTSPLIQKFGEALRVQRHLLGLSQQEVADLANVSVNLLRQVEAGKDSAHFDKILDILTALGLQFQLTHGQQRIVLPKVL